jgi:hypothetical protein
MWTGLLDINERINEKKEDVKNALHQSGRMCRMTDHK